MSADPFIGDIQLYPFNFAPRNWIPCRGQLLDIMDNQALFALIGATYGGDGRNTFAAPNLQGAEPIPGMHYCIALDGMFPPRT